MKSPKTKKVSYWEGIMKKIRGRLVLTRVGPHWAIAAQVGMGLLAAIGWLCHRVCQKKMLLPPGNQENIPCSAADFWDARSWSSCDILASLSSNIWKISSNSAIVRKKKEKERKHIKFNVMYKKVGRENQC